MVLPRSGSSCIGGVLLLACCLEVAVMVSMLSGPCRDLHSMCTFISAPASRMVSRRRTLHLLAPVAPPSLFLPSAVGALSIPKSDPQFDQYIGKATDLRSAATWYRFFVGDLIRTGSGETRDGELGIKPNSDRCGGGLCASGKALTQVQRLLTSNGGKVSLVDNAVTAPMTIIAQLPVFDPDTADIAQSEVNDFSATLTTLRETIRKDFDGDQAKALYTKSLKQLNVFFRETNEASGVKPEEDPFLPQLPLTQADLDSSEYWTALREAFDERSSDPIAQLQERNAIGPKEWRQALKRFPGATLLLR